MELCTKRKRIELRFDRIIKADSGEEEYIICEMDVSQTTRLNSHRIEFIFGLGDFEDSLVDESVPTDIMTLYRKGLSDTEIKLHMKGLTELYIESQEIHDIEKYAEEIQGVAVDGKTPQNEATKWIIPIPSELDHYGEINLKYKYKFLFPAPGFGYFHASEPTKGFTCVIDATKLADDVNIYMTDMLNARNFVHKSDSEQGKLGLSTADWVIPKSSVFFHWYKNETKTP